MSTSWSQRSAFRTAGAAFVVAALLVACSAGDPPAEDRARVVVTDTIEVPERQIEREPDPERERDGARPDAPTAPSTTVEPQLGEVDVAVVQRLPRLELSWMEVELDLPDASSGGVELRFAGFVAGEMVIVGQSIAPPRQTLSTWRSTDGLTWDRTDHPLDAQAWVNSVSAVGERLLATGDRQGPVGRELMVLGSDAAGRWRPIDLGIDTAGAVSWLQASNGRGVVMVVERFDPTTFEGARLTLETDQHVLLLDEGNGTYELTDRATGAVVATGTTDEIYGWHEDGQAVWDLETRHLLTVVPWEVWHAAWPGGPMLPVPIPVDQDVGPHVIEYGGYRIVLDDRADRVEVVDLLTDEVVVTTSHEQFFRGPSPRFVDDVTGDVVWSPTWAEWDQLSQMAYDRQVDVPIHSEPQRSLLVSPDTVDWTEIDLGSAYDGWVESLVAVAGEYQLVVADHTTGVPARQLARSPDGVEWTWTTIEDDERIIQMTAGGPDGAIAVTSSEMGSDPPALATSADGIAWSPAFQLARQDDGRHAWFELLATGPGGRAALATLVPEGAELPLTITIDDRTARFGSGEMAVTITDAAGDIVLEATWDDLQRSLDDGGAEPIATYDDGVTTFWAPDRSIVMQIPDETVAAAYDLQHQAHLDQTERFLFVEREGAWYEVEVPLGGGTYAQAMAIGEQAVLIGAGAWGEPGFDDGDMDAAMATVVLHVGHLGIAR